MVKYLINCCVSIDTLNSVKIGQNIYLIHKKNFSCDFFGFLKGMVVPGTHCDGQERCVQRYHLSIEGNGDSKLVAHLVVVGV